MHSIVRRALVILLVSAATLGAAVPISTAASHQNAAPAKNTYGAAALYGVGGGKLSGSAAIMGAKGGLRVVVSVSGLAPMSKHALAHSRGRLRQQRPDQAAAGGPGG